MSASPFEIRPFRRSDRDQLTRLVNAHVAAVIPGARVSVNAVLSQLEREPGEFVVDHWVGERHTLVAEQQGSVVAAAHLLRHRHDPDVVPAYRNTGSIRWLLHWPLAPEGNPHWNDGVAAAEGLLGRAVEQFERWSVSRQLADISLPTPGVYGVPDQWPHVARALERAGFVQRGRTELVLLAEMAKLVAEDPAPVDGLTVERSVGMSGTRFTAVGAAGGAPLALVEADVVDRGDARASGRPLADVGNLWVDPDHRRRGVGRWLLGRAALWLRLGGVDRILGYAWPDQIDDPDEQASLAFHLACGFHPITRTRKGWERVPQSGPGRAGNRQEAAVGRHGG